MLLKEIEYFLEEDLGHEEYEDIVPSTECTAEITVKEPGILAGLEEVKQILDYARLHYATDFTDGDLLEAEDRILSVRGPGSTILKTERLMLNFLGRMSGIATLTHELVTEARKVNAQLKIAGTRKTTPGFRKYEKKAIALGGGDPHRFGLYEAVIIKDNHIQLMGLEQAIRTAKERTSFTRMIEVEVESIEDALRAAELEVRIIMLDNMPPARVRECVQLLAARGLRDGLILEASGGITQSNLHDYAATGVDVISLGMLTHSARWLGFSLQLLG